MTVLNQICYYQTIFYFNFQFNKNVFYFNSIITTLKMDNRNNNNLILHIILLHEKFLQFDWLRGVVFQLNLKYLHVKITNLLAVVV